MTTSLLDATDAERALIGEVVFNPRCARTLTDLVAPQDFASPALGALYELAVGMAAAGEQLDTISFTQAVTKRRQGQQRGDVRWPTPAELAGLIGLGVGAHAPTYARQVAEAALRRAHRGAAVRAAQAAETAADVATLVPDALDDFRAVRDRHAGRRAGAKTLGELLDTVDEGYDWVIPGLLERADRLMLTGDEGAGKSMLLRQLLIAAGAGIHPFTYEAIKPVRGLAIDAENSERQWRRKSSGLTLMAARNGSADPREMVHVECTPRLDLVHRASDLAYVHQLLDEHDPQLLLIGPLYKLTSRAITTDDDAAPLITALDSIRDRGVTLLIEAHAGHVQGASGSRNLRPRGSAALLGWPEFGFGLAWSTDPNLGDVIGVDVVRWRGDRDERDWPTLLYRGGPFPWTDKDSPEHARRAMYGQHTTPDRWSR